MDRDKDEETNTEKTAECTSLRIVAFQSQVCLPLPVMAAPWFCPDATKAGYLPPWEVAKAFAFHTVLLDVAEIQGVQPHDLARKRVDEYISGKVTRKGGGHPSSRAVRKLLKCESPDRTKRSPPPTPPIILLK